jgi:hypothetical protein
MAEIVKGVKGFEGFEPAEEECCVCYKALSMKTNCGHSICSTCIAKLPTDWAEDDFTIFLKGQKCPLCRAYIFYFYH